MSGCFRSTRKFGASAIAMLCIAGSASADDPLAGRYEPYAAFDFNKAVVYAQATAVSENGSYTSLLSWYYSSQANLKLQILWGDVFTSYVAGEISWAAYHDELQEAALDAYYASQYAYKAYLEKPTANAQSASGWSYYGAVAAYSAAQSPPPPQDLSNDLDRELRLTSYRIRARYSSTTGVFITRDPSLDIAAKHHAAYLANAGFANYYFEGNMTPLQYIPQNSPFVPKAGSTVAVYAAAAANGAIFYRRQVYPGSPDAPQQNSVLGIGMARNAAGTPCWCVLVAKSQ